MILSYPGGGLINVSSAEQTFNAECTVDEAIGNVVYIYGTKIGSLYRVRNADIDDISKMPAVGIVVRKPSSTECVVQVSGIAKSVLTGLTPNSYLFADTGSSLTQIRPSNPISGIRFIQIVAQAISDTDILVRFFSPVKLVST